MKERLPYRLYDLSWRVATPFLYVNHRLRQGFDQRTLRRPLAPADLWIQAASAGEAYMAWTLLRNLRSGGGLKVLVTSGTKRGMEILEAAFQHLSHENKPLKLSKAYFPFDSPKVMRKAVGQVRPRLMVLLESEIWPGLFVALRKNHSKILIINGRMAEKSLPRYLTFSTFWREISPERILAVSESDAERFSLLFGRDRVETMQNLKFERIYQPTSAPHVRDQLMKLFPQDIPFIVLGSVRREEERLIRNILLEIHRRRPDAVIGLFPRHMHRIKHWEKALKRLALPWSMRSTIQTRVAPGTVILWDVFGELTMAYSVARTAFVGGSLRPLGGQNFLEAVFCGIVPVIGPFWEDFAWVGEEILHQGLVYRASDWKEVAGVLLNGTSRWKSREEVREAALAYVKHRQGGSRTVCALIGEYLSGSICH